MSQTIGKTRLAQARTWHHINLSTTPLTLGRVASRVALCLMGKHKPTYDPSTDCGDYVVATNCLQVKTTGKKMQQKLYYSHSTRPGSLKSISMEKMMDKWGGAEILRRAVRGMLPKNRLRDVRLRRLRAFEGDAHPYKANLVKYPNQGVKDLLVQQAILQMAVEKEASGVQELEGREIKI